uniref:Lipocalin/cytosolic fatty-acid binding domain-containing protein n=1 Tax=Rattus norvegicus TaxID=10116 RepID=M0R460_RAT
MMVSNMDGGDLYVKIKIWVTGYCYNIEVHLRKTNEPLKYTALKGTSVIYIVKIPVKDHCIFFCEGKRHRKRYCKAKLVGRDSKDNPEAMEEFKKFVKSKGLRLEYIIVPERREHC